MAETKNKKSKKLYCDFETTVTGDPNQSYTEVRSFAVIESDAPNEYDSVTVGYSMEEFFKKLFSYRNGTTIAYFHNEKFDGSFILDYLLKHGFKVGMILIEGFTNSEEDKEVMKHAKKDLLHDEFICLISAKGQWYSITIKHNSRIYEIRDTYKLIPFSLREIGRSFKTEHQKLEMDYICDSEYASECRPLTDEEVQYQKNDVLVLKEAMNIMEAEGHTKMTIGSCCMHEFKSKYHPLAFKQQFPNLYEVNIATLQFGSETMGDYIRNSYKGGWCYLNPKWANIHFQNVNGTTADVNSLYPSMMHSDSGNYYPVGNGHLFKGDLPDYLKNRKDVYYFIRVKTRFYLKDGYLPTIQIKNSMLYHPRQWLTSSDYVDKEGNHFRYLMDNGEKYQMIPTLTLTMTDWEMLQKHYNLEDTEILDGVWFNARIGLFDEYINKYAEIKMNAPKGAKRQIAKLFLNNLYGKFATSTDASYKVPFLGDDDVVHFYSIDSSKIAKAGYIPIGSAVTSYSRAFTITAAQKNYNNFVYADTDSIHVLCEPDDIIGAPEDPVKFNHWKYEACWDEAIFVRAKTYIEHVTHEDREELEKPYYNVKCAGMPDRAKANYQAKILYEPLKDTDDIKEYEAKIGVKNLTKTEIEFHKSPKMSLEDFKVGLAVPGSLKPKRVKGGIVLLNGEYVMRPSLF